MANTFYCIPFIKWIRCRNQKRTRAHLKRKAHLIQLSCGIINVMKNHLEREPFRTITYCQIDKKNAIFKCCQVWWWWVSRNDNECRWKRCWSECYDWDALWSIQMAWPGRQDFLCNWESDPKKFASHTSRQSLFPFLWLNLNKMKSFWCLMSLFMIFTWKYSFTHLLVLKSFIHQILMDVSRNWQSSRNWPMSRNWRHFSLSWDSLSAPIFHIMITYMVLTYEIKSCSFQPQSHPLISKNVVFSSRNWHWNHFVIPVQRCFDDP